VEPISNPIPADLFNDPDRFVGVQVAGYDEMVPRQRFGSVPYVFHANHATTATVALDADLLNGVPATVLAPPGAVMAYAGSVPPEGWLVCDGSAVNRTQYAALFAAITTTQGSGDGATTFNLPDYRGYFLRGVDAGVGRDPDAASRTAASSGGNTGDAVGTVQEDNLQSHKHNDLGHAHSYSQWYGQGKDVCTNSNDTTVANDGYRGATTGSAVANLGDPVDSGTGAGFVRHGAETRPKNAYVIWIIKY
jgi:microcystin-dependent protein